MRNYREPLTRERILLAALKILDKQGLAGLSMRKLASSLNVEAMSLYNHIKDKKDLLDGLADLVLSQYSFPDTSLPWKQRLSRLSDELYRILILHPALLPILASEQGSPSDLKITQGIDSIIAALEEAGLSPIQQVNAYRGLLAMCLGFVFVHTQGLTKTKEQAQAEWDNYNSPQWDADALPHLAQLSPFFKKTHADEDFQFMLNAYLDYLETIRKDN